MLSVAIIADLLEEKWASMDLVAEMLFEEIRSHHSDIVRAELIRPRALRLLGRAAPNRSAAINMDRGFNRFAFYPGVIRRIASSFELFHVTDHSYAHLALMLPPERTIVTCHDIDAFRCLVDSGSPSRSWYPFIARRLLSGMQRAAVVICDSYATYEDLVKYRLVGPHKLSVIPVGVAPEYSPASNHGADSEVVEMLGPAKSQIEIVHVGRTVPRKRIDILLNVFAEVRRTFPAAKLIRAGGGFTAEHRRLINRLSLGDAIVELPFVSRRLLAAVYRRATVVMIPSEAEGFGLPVVESLACGTPVICSDIPALREVGGDAAAYCGVGDIDGWVSTLSNLLYESESHPREWDARRAAGLRTASRFSWATHANEVASVYQKVWAAAETRSASVERDLRPDMC